MELSKNYANQEITLFLEQDEYQALSDLKIDLSQFTAVDTPIDQYYITKGVDLYYMVRSPAEDIVSWLLSFDSNEPLLAHLVDCMRSVSDEIGFFVHEAVGYAVYNPSAITKLVARDSK